MRIPLAEKLANLRRPSVEPTPRKGFTKAQRQAVYDLQRGQCAECEGRLDDGFEIDHVISIAMGGSHEPGNWLAKCPDCHLRKTKADVKAIAKSKRLAKSETELRQSKIRSRGFTGWRAFDGTVRKT